MESSRIKKPILLAVLAHPDDETFGMGGTLALYASRGVAVHLVCATRGEVGQVDDRYMQGFNSVAECRVHELLCAAGHLGLAGVHFLGYRDSGMLGSPDNQHPQSLASQPTEKVAAEVAHYIRLLKPQVVLTFDPIGGYRHPDHIAIHNAAVVAFDLADDPQNLQDGLLPYKPQKLYFNTMPKTMVRVAVGVLRFLGRDPAHFGRNGDIDLDSIAAVSFPTHARIDFRPVFSQRNLASECHASQGGGQMSRGVVGWMRRLFAYTETFMRAYPPVIKNIPERDLFDQVDTSR
jgi:N-acetyl-1-D-myo-inositol-2-amino-2-deoxy-alpha-D-glucopyranoside deacetylase